jgi:hypothetical protein
MERHEYLVIYQIGSNEQTVTELPVNVHFNKGADATEKYETIKKEIGYNEGGETHLIEIRILGIYKL